MFVRNLLCKDCPVLTSNKSRMASECGSQHQESVVDDQLLNNIFWHSFCGKLKKYSLINADWSKTDVATWCVGISSVENLSELDS